MYNLILNENMKIYRRLRTWIMIGLLIALVVLISVIVKVNSAPTEDWRSDLQQRIEVDRDILSYESSERAIKQLEESIAIAEYQLEHDIMPLSQSPWGMMEILNMLVALVLIFTVIIAADTVAGEFSTGTIKLLLIRPSSRSKILLSKYISMFMYAILLLVVLIGSSLITNGLLYGFSGLNTMALSINEAGNIVTTSPLVDLLKTYGYQSVELIMVVTMAFMISTVFRSSSLAIGLSIFLMMVGPSVSFFLMRYDWGKYWLFMNTDLTQYKTGEFMVEGMTLGFSISVLIAYFILFNVLSWWLFNKRDVAS